MRISLGVALLLLVLYSAFVEFGPRPREPRFQSGDQRNRHAIEQFMRDQQRVRTVIVGSSMTERLGNEVADGCTYNLALRGESSQTGLAVLNRSRAKPERVLIEANVPERVVNERLVNEGTRLLPRLVPALATQNMPVNVLFSFLSRHKPSTNADEVALSRALQTERDLHAHEMPSSLLNPQIETLKGQVRELERSGVQVMFFELPVHLDLEDTPRARQIRAALAAAFPRQDYIGWQTLAQGMTIRTIDGVHLAPGELEAVAHRLRQHTAGECAASGSPRSMGSQSALSKAGTNG